MTTSPFDPLDPERVIGENALATAFLDRFPVSQGHTLVIPKRAVGRLADLSRAEQEALWDLVTEVTAALQEKHAPDGFNIGLNDGEAAGQTVPHLHLHVIPRYAGDVPDPRGGIRWVIPAKAPYWDPASPRSE